MQVCGEGSVGVGADVDGVIIVVILEKRDPLCSGELLFQVTSDDLLLLPSKGGGVLMRLCLVQGRMPRRGRSNRLGGPLMGRARPHTRGGPGPMHL
jgi:hypothetical protein